MPKKGQNKHKYYPKPKVTQNTEVVRQVKVTRTLPEYVPLQYSDGLMIQVKDGMFILSLLQNQYPLAVSLEEIRLIKTIEQRCIAQILITPHHMARDLAVLNRHFNAFIEEQGEESQEYLKALLQGKKEDEEEDEDEDDKTNADGDTNEENEEKRPAK